MTKKLLLLLFSATLFWACSTSKKHSNSRKGVVHFTWSSGTIGGKEYKHTAIFVPVKIDTLNNPYKMQLDLGAPSNLFYGGVLSNIIKHYPYLKSKVTKTDSADYTWFKAPMSIGNHSSKLKIKTGKYYSDIGKNDLNNISKKDSISDKEKKYLNGKSGNIGEIGVNQFENTVLVIDFKSQKLWTQDSLNKEAKANYSFTDLELKGRNRLVMQLKVGTEVTKVMYDTGSSIISIATFNNNLFNKLRGKSVSKPDSLMVNGIGGKKIKWYKDKLRKNIYLNDIQLNSNNENVFYIKYWQGLSKMTGAKYLVGNKFFSGRKIIIDLKDHKFGINKK